MSHLTRMVNKWTDLKVVTTTILTDFIGVRLF
jgi:hypothetical protein